MTFRVGIGVTIDASGAKTGAGEARQAVQSIGDAAQGATSKLQQLINTSVGMHDAGAVAGAKAWTGALASEGMALDTLRAKYSPLFATIQQYKAAQTEIRTAHAMGALSADEMAAALTRQRQQALSTIAAIKGLGTAQAEATAQQARLAALTAQYDPLYAAAERYRQALADIAAAEQAGALAADRATAARLKARAAYSAAIDTETGREARGQSQATAIVGRQTIVPDREADVAAYGASLDELRAKYSPLYATIQQYKVAQAEIREAHAVGAISADEMSAALIRQRQAALGAIAAIKSAPSAHGGQGSAFQTANIAAQFQDIGVTAAMGMNPLQIALQQGTQLSSVLATSEKPLESLLSGFGSLFSMTSLVTIGVVGLGAAAIQLFMNWKSGAETADQALEKHADLIRQIKDEYKSAGAGLAEMLRPSDGVTTAYAKENEHVLRALYSDAANTLVRRIGPNESSGISRGADQYANTSFAEPIKAFLASVKSGTPDVESFREAIAGIYNSSTDQRTRTMAIGLLDASKSASELARSLPSAAAAIDSASRKAEALAEHMKAYAAELSKLGTMGLQPLSPQQEIERQYQLTVSQATNREQRDDAADARAHALDRLREQLDLTRQSDDLGTRAILARTAAERANIAAEQARIAGLQGHQDADQIAQAERAARANVFAQDQAAAADRLRQAQRSASTVGLTGLPAQIAQINAAYADEIERATGDAAAIERLTQARALEIETAKRAAAIDPLRQSAQSSTDLALQVAQQGAGFGRSAEEAARLSEAMRLYAEYARQGVQITPELASAIDVAARRYGKAAGEMDKLAKAQQETIAGLDAMRSTGRSVLDKLVGGDLKGGLTAALDGIKGRWLDMLSQSLFGQQGTAETGSLGSVLAPLFGVSTGARGSAGNPMWVTWAGNAVGSGLFGSAANNNALGTVGGTGRSTSMLDLIARAEGTDKGRGYNETLGYGRFTGTRNLTGMTLDQIDALQTEMLANPANAYNSSALGRYQITRTTLRGLRDQLGLSGSDLYDPAMQDKLAMQLLARRGNSLTGLRQEWTGLGRVDDATLQRALGGAGSSGSGPLDLGQYLNADWAKQQANQIGGVFGTLTNSLGSIVDQFLPGFGSSLGTLLNGIGNAGGGSGGGLFGWLGSLFGGSSSGYGSLGVGTGGLYANGGVPGAAGLHRFVNQVVDRPTTFAFARGAGLMGEAGPEAIMPLTRDAAGRLGVRAASDAPTANSGSSVVINNYSGGQVQTEERTDDQGRRQTVVTIGEMTAGAVSQRGNPLRRSLQSEFGLRPRGIVR